MPQYATLKAIGYPTRFLLRVVLEQAALNGLAGWIPAWLAGILLYRVIGEVALLPMRMSLGNHLFEPRLDPRHVSDLGGNRGAAG